MMVLELILGVPWIGGSIPLPVAVLILNGSEVGLIGILYDVHSIPNF